MVVRDGMNRTVVTVGPGHTLREAARRMTRADVGAAVVIDPDGEGPAIFTERDLLHACGAGDDLDTDLVEEHLTQRLTYADADWSLERAAEQMVSGRYPTSSCSTGPKSSASSRCATSCAAGQNACAESGACSQERPRMSLPSWPEFRDVARLRVHEQ